MSDSPREKEKKEACQRAWVKAKKQTDKWQETETIRWAKKSRSRKVKKVAGLPGGDWKRQRDLGGRKAYRENTAAFGGQACSWSRSPVPVTTRSSAPPAGRTRPGNVHFSAHLLQGPVWKWPCFSVSLEKIKGSWLLLDLWDLVNPLCPRGTPSPTFRTKAAMWSASFGFRGFRGEVPFLCFCTSRLACKTLCSHVSSVFTCELCGQATFTTPGLMTWSGTHHFPNDG